MNLIKNCHSKIKNRVIRMSFYGSAILCLSPSTSCTSDDLETAAPQNEEILAPTDTIEADGEVEGEPKVIVTSPPKKS